VKNEKAESKNKKLLETNLATFLIGSIINVGVVK